MSTNDQDLPVLTVSQLTNAIKMCLESTFPLLWLQGEVSNCKSHTSGHLYLSLKDNNAQIAAVMYRADAARLKMIPKDGDRVIVRGELNVYAQGGKYQLVIKELRPVGLGELLQKLEELKIKLNKKGYFKKEHKKPLPKMPKRIGVVTSPTGAVIQDILHVLTRRFSGFHLILNPVKVQGEGAAQEIAQAIKQFNDHHLVDVMIVGRGGGSIEDLWAFNEEVVADAIFHSKIPIISAVGHETDHCIADYVADVRAPTPSVAAELVIAEKDQQLTYLAQLQQRMQQTMRHLIRHQKQQLIGISRHPIFLSPYGILGAWMQKLDDLRQDTDDAVLQKITHFKHLLDARQKHVQSMKPTTQIHHFRQKLTYFDKSFRAVLLVKITTWKKRVQQIEGGLFQLWQGQQKNRRRLFQAESSLKQIDYLMKKGLAYHKEKVQKVTEALHAVNPKNLLSKGYAIVFAENDHSVITSVRAVQKQQDLRILLSDGEILSTVKNVAESD